MNLKGEDPKYIAVNILERSICAVQVGACIEDKTGILAVGWNSVGKGFGWHAEAHAVYRANRNRVKGSTIYIAAKRKRNGVNVIARPCDACMPYLVGMNIWWRDKTGIWRND